MTRVELLALADDIEKAREGSRALNCRIAVAVGWHRIEPRFTPNKKQSWVSPKDPFFRGFEANGTPIFTCDSLRGDCVNLLRDPPNFTGSLDAAVTTVKPDHEWSIESVSGACVETLYCSHSACAVDAKRNIDLARSFCAAAIRAMAEEVKG